MKKIRIIAVAVLLGAGGLALHAAQVQQLGIKRTDLLRQDLSVPGREIVQVRVDFAPGWSSASTVIPAKRSPMSLRTPSTTGGTGTRAT